MSDDQRPDPDRLLAAMTKTHRQGVNGRLCIFFGMAAGVGKTTAMLEAARQKKVEGIDVVIGIIHTHGRTEVLKLTEGIERIPEREVTHRGVVFKEMNLSAILYRQPQLVLVDELAHSNVEGSRHPYRWQDVLDLLHAGIDVYTTLNVQHVESRKELVENITHVTVRETVPDSIIEMASEIKLVDISATELLARLKEGKVYLGEKSFLAAANFFKEENLTALREIALRLTAEKVDFDLQGLLALGASGDHWRATERLMVAVSHSPYSQQLIRATRRLAFTLKASWIAVHVDNGVVLTDEEKAELSKNLTLARALGAEVITAADPEVSECLKRIAREKRVTQLVLGRPPPSPLKQFLTGGSLVDHLMGSLTECDIYIAHQEPIGEVPKPRWSKLEFNSSAWTYWIAAIGMAIFAILSALLEPFIGYHLIGLLFLFVLMCGSLIFGRGPLLLAACVGAVAWFLFFFPSGFTPSLHVAEDLFVLGLLFFSVLISSVFIARIHKRETMLRLREEQSRMLYDVMKEITTAPTRKDLLNAVSERLGLFLKGTVGIALQNEQGDLDTDTQWSVVTNEKERAVAIWVLRNGQMAGWSTDTLSSVGVLYLPLKATETSLGVLAFRPKRQQPLDLEEMNFLQTVVQQLTMYFERSQYEEKERMGEYLRHADTLQQAILDSVSQELKAPLDSIKDSVMKLSESTMPPDQKKEIDKIREGVDTLDRGLANLLELSKLSSGFLEMNRDYYSVNDLIQASVDTMKPHFENHQVEVATDANLPFLYVDPNLLDLVLINLLMNAVAYSPPGKRIFVSAERKGKEIVISVADEGQGIPSHAVTKIFEKFYRLPGSPRSGLGLGLAVAKAIVEVHGGHIVVSNRPEGGALFSVALPIEAYRKRTK